jgi:sucrose-6-phosphate hydrolase SacC (GH32 family)
MRKSHLKGLHECPDLFELPVDGDPRHTKWILHGGSSSYFIGSFDGESFKPESPELRYAEGVNVHGDDVLYAAQSFAEMPGGRRVQMAWGRIKPEGMPFSQMMLFPTKFNLVTTRTGLQMRATPIAEIERLRRKTQAWSSLTAADANHALNEAGSEPLDVRLSVTLEKDDELTIRYRGNTIFTILSAEFENGGGFLEILIDKGVAEIFVDGGARYLVTELPTSTGGHGLELGLGRNMSRVNRLEICRMKSIWTDHD